ncbi:alpha/beta hydrolase [Exilibacterium tricleocarpae]|uniref:Alpha/beta hydrolase n=1 Tax=Exilibacterium tricleocarpae TaxID=2591008 RepID=A0A545TBB0_9GAMM|nr:alpha/beta hydrolase [Exilibacterium tricleocarpae]TQV74503.1 alpha/beta hydrolase [Exilibacterium tricleocarpae]
MKKFSFFTGIVMLVALCASSLGLLPRPQNPKKRPYRIKPVQFKGGGTDVILAGELTVPHGEGPFPATIMITGSGPQDRDETAVGHKPFLVLSDHLTRSGFAVLRYDDRGVGDSTGEFVSDGMWKPTMEDFAKDAAAAYHFLQGLPEVNQEKIGFVAHSEGGYIAPAAAELVPAAFMVLLAGAALPLLPDVILTQIADVTRAQGKPQKDIEHGQDLFKDITKILKTSVSTSDARSHIEARLKSHGATRTEIKANMEVWGSDWARYYANYNPLPALRQFKKPVLALFGDRDLQVSAVENAPVVESALSNPESEVIVFQNLNHLFQPSESGKVEEYVWINTTIDPIVLRKITDWLSARTRTDL